MTALDVPVLCRMGMRLAQESNFYDGYEFNEEGCYYLAEQFLDAHNYYSALYEEDGIIKGMLLGMYAQNLFVKMSCAGDLLFYVEPQYRKGSIAKELVQDFVNWAKLRGCDKVTIGNSSGYKPEAVSRFFGSCGLKRIGYVHAMELK